MWRYAMWFIIIGLAACVLAGWVYVAWRDQRNRRAERAWEQEKGDED